MNQTGYQATPWNEGAYSCAIRQYSSAGRLSGYNGNLDLNKFYGDKNTWMKYCNPDSAHEDTGGSTTPPHPASPTGSTLDLVVGTMQGKIRKWRFPQNSTWIQIRRNAGYDQSYQYSICLYTGIGSQSRKVRQWGNQKDCAGITI